jgi:prephenate dehydratase
VKVAFQGERGAYSEEAILQYCGKNVELVPRPSLEDVFDSVENNETDLGVVPLENSIQGSIVQTFDLLNERSLMIQGETILRVRHCLIANNGLTLKDIKKVYSHPQALGQSKEYLVKHHLVPISTYDTAGSVKMLKEKGLKNAAAIASSRAAKVYDMKILVEGIETHKKNYTRFLVIGHDEPEITGMDKTTMVFLIRNESGSLTKALKTIANRNINLTKIETRPLIGRPWEYQFFVEIEGHKNDYLVAEAIDELRTVSYNLKILGSYPRSNLKY